MKFIPLGSETLLCFQQWWKAKKLVIIDKFSMHGQSDLHFIDCRLRQIKGNNYPFGSLVLLLCDDPGQLPPVNALSLWDKHGKSGSSNFYGLLLYQQFDVMTKLTKKICLNKNDSDAVCYNNFLLFLHDGANTQENWEWIKNTAAQSTQCRAKIGKS